MIVDTHIDEREATGRGVLSLLVMRAERTMLGFAAWARKNPKVSVSAIAVLCLSLRLIHLADKSLWIDEIWSLGIARLSWHSLGWVIYHQDPNSLLYYGLLHLWLRLGDSEVSLRGLSVLLATATIPIVYLLGKRLNGQLAGLAASTFLAINIFHIQWSQETRGYALLVLAVCLSSLYFVRCIETPTFSNWAAYFLIGTLSMYVHLFAGLVLLAHWVSLFFLRPNSVPWRGLVTSTASIFLGTTPLLWLVYVRSKAPFVPLDWLPRPNMHAVYDSFYQLAGNANYPESQGGKAILGVYFVLCTLALLSLYESARVNGRSIKLWHTGLLFCWLLVPISFIFAGSLMQPMYVSRYLLVSLPAMTLLAARGVCRIRPKRAAVLMILLVVSLETSGLVGYYRYRSNFQEWRAVTQKVLAEAQPGDGIVFCVAPGHLLFDYYKEHADTATHFAPEVIYPEAALSDDSPGTLDYLPPMSDAHLNNAASSHSRMWLVVYHDFFRTTEHARNHLEDILGNKYSQEGSTRINGVTVTLYSRTSQVSQLAH